MITTSSIVFICRISCQQFSVEKGLSAGEKIFSLNQYHFAEALGKFYFHFIKYIVDQHFERKYF